MKKVFPLLLIVVISVGFASAGLVKRDTFSDIGDSIKDGLGLNDDGIMGELEDIDKTKYCLADSGCYEHVQYCNKETYKLYGHCEFQIWFWVSAIALMLLLLCSCILSILCCCCSSFCRKSR
eukprot:GFUD01011541.1.p1 GENE.GFUD01011541.1~~GFUD01011541.1.p1  ORF type:complete len:122 (+),score=28.97 GFUD01011541.1:210-575(+)